jgi:signal transduction histidine kinase
MLLALVAMVAVPLGLLALLAVRLVGREERLVRESFAELALAQLQDLRQSLRALVEERENRALGAPDLLRSGGDDVETLRRFVRREPFFRAALLLDPEGRVLFPPPGPERTAQESAFLLRARALVRDPGALLAAASAAGEEARSASAHGWHVWYDADDIDLLFWQRATSSRILGLEVDRARLLADVIARLPDGAGAERSFALLDARGEILHRWGDYLPPPEAPPLAALALQAPLASWQLVVHAPAPALGPLRVGLWSGLGLGLTAVALALSGLAVFLHREHTRGLRLAEQRVSFVNRVSHELKTPLTNIRLYAELLQERLGEDDADARRQIEVVVAEGQRLGRLIDNVLTFGRHQRGALRLRPARGVVDDVIERVAGRWRAPLEAKAVRLELRLGAAGDVLLDADAVTQILDNLLGNVEKYAAAGGVVTVSSERRGDLTTVTVADLGPGIPHADRERVFLPFQRLDESVSAGPSGTGIGLAVVRELARLHGGDARVREGAAGACFEVTLATPAAPGGEP